MPAALTPVRYRQQARAIQLQQLVDLVEGTPGYGVPVKFWELSHATEYALTVRNYQGKHFRIMNKSYPTVTTPDFEVNDTGVFSRGVAVIDATSTQTLSNKTFSFVDLISGPAPSAAAAGVTRVYVKNTDNRAYQRHGSGVEEVFAAGASAPGYYRGLMLGGA
jgi:hypothetical protein